MNKLQQIPAAFPRLYDVSDSIKVVEVAKKYEGPEVSPCLWLPLSDIRPSLTGHPNRELPLYASPSTPHPKEATSTTAAKVSRRLQTSHRAKADTPVLPVATSWTQGFFPGLLWLLEERRRLLPEAVEPSYSDKEILRLARRYQESFKFLAKEAINHDQGFRFQLCYGKLVGVSCAVSEKS